MRADTLSRANFTGQFNLITFPCSPPPSLTPGSYFATLTSPAPDPQSTAYFIKGYSGSTVATGTGRDDVVPGTTTTDSAGLNLEKAGATAITSGGVQTYTISIGNSGATTYQKFTILTLRDQLPAGVTATAVSPVTGLSSASCTPLNVAGALLTCTFTLNTALGAATEIPNGPAFSITATMPTTAGDLTNWASIDPAGGTAYPAPVNCTLPPCAQQTTTIQALPAPLLSIAKAAPVIVNAGTQLTYTVSIGNMGTASLAAGSTIPVLDQLWPGTTFVSAAPSTGVSVVSCNATVNPMACSVTLATALANGTEVSNGAKFTITIVAPLTAPQDAFANYVSVAESGTGTPPTPGQTCLIEQCASVGTRLAYPGVQLTKTGPATVVAGNNITYTIRLGNNGTGPIPGNTVVLVSDKLPLSSTFVSAAPVTGVADPVTCAPPQDGVVTCSVTVTADLVNGTAPAVGPAVTITATVDPLSVGDSTNYASVAPDGVSMPPTPGTPLCVGPNCGSTTVAVSAGARANSIIYGVDDAGVVWETNLTSQISTAVLDAKSLLGTGTPPFFNGMAFQATATGGILFWLNSHGAIVAWVRQSGGPGIVATQSQLGASTSGNPSNGAWYLDSFWYVETVAAPRVASTAKLYRASFTDPASSSLPTFTGVTNYTISFGANDVLVGFGDIVFSKAGSGVLYLVPRSAPGSPASPTAPMFAAGDVAAMMASGSATAVTIRATGVGTKQLLGGCRGY